jgi:hypothetical protein
MRTATTAEFHAQFRETIRIRIPRLIEALIEEPSTGRYPKRRKIGSRTSRRKIEQFQTIPSATL